MSSKPITETMEKAIRYMQANSGKMVRYPGGYWAKIGWHWHNGIWFGTPTVEALVRRGLAEYTEWRDGKGGSQFPITVELKGGDA